MPFGEGGGCAVSPQPTLLALALVKLPRPGVWGRGTRWEVPKTWVFPPRNGWGGVPALAQLPWLGFALVGALDAHSGSCSCPVGLCPWG